MALVCLFLAKVLMSFKAGLMSMCVLHVVVPLMRFAAEGKRGQYVFLVQAMQAWSLLHD